VLTEPLTYEQVVQKRPQRDKLKELDKHPVP